MVTTNSVRVRTMVTTSRQHHPSSPWWMPDTNSGPPPWLWSPPGRRLAGIDHASNCLVPQQLADVVSWSFAQPARLLRVCSRSTLFHGRSPTTWTPTSDDLLKTTRSVPTILTVPEGRRCSPDLKPTLTLWQTSAPMSPFSRSRIGMDVMTSRERGAGHFSREATPSLPKGGSEDSRCCWLTPRSRSCHRRREDWHFEALSPCSAQLLWNTIAGICSLLTSLTVVLRFSPAEKPVAGVVGFEDFARHHKACPPSTPAIHVQPFWPPLY